MRFELTPFNLSVLGLTEKYWLDTPYAATGSEMPIGKTCTHRQAAIESVIHQKQVIADSSGQAATVWDLGGQPAKDSGTEYSRLFKEIMGALK
ncbi:MULTISPECIES: hypothetical protein [unclassified Microcoleus]|uniref:hypothetical protein n=1 Tax=unclassified Microcoleus TaxID=2642155 RepID=UPI002FCE811D